MRKTLKYLSIFVWAVLFLYYFNMFIPKNIWYFVIGIPALSISCYMLNITFDKILYKKN